MTDPKGAGILQLARLQVLLALDSAIPRSSPAGSVCRMARIPAFNGAPRDVLRVFEHNILRCQPFTITWRPAEIPVAYS